MVPKGRSATASAGSVTAAGRRSAAHLRGMRPRLTAVPAQDPARDRHEKTREELLAALDAVTGQLVALRAEVAAWTAPDSTPPPSLLSVPEAAVLMGIGRSSVCRLVDAGDLTIIRIGSRALIARAEIEAWVSARVPAGAV